MSTDDEPAGEWIVRASGQGPHVCKMPAADEPVGSVWRCECGARWELIKGPSPYGIGERPPRTVIAGDRAVWWRCYWWQRHRRPTEPVAPSPTVSVAEHADSPTSESSGDALPQVGVTPDQDPSALDPEWPGFPSWDASDIAEDGTGLVHRWNVYGHVIRVGPWLAWLRQVPEPDSECTDLSWWQAHYWWQPAGAEAVPEVDGGTLTESLIWGGAHVADVLPVFTQVAGLHAAVRSMFLSSEWSTPDRGGLVTGEQLIVDQLEAG